MAKWYHRISRDMAHLERALDHFETEYAEAQKEVKLNGLLSELCHNLPSIYEYRFAQLQELNAIVEHLDQLVEMERAKAIRRYHENYNRQLSENLAKKYAESDPEVVATATLRQSVALLRDRFIGVVKALEMAQYLLSNIAKLRNEDVIL